MNSKKILVVDDDADICEIFSEILSNYQTQTANDGQRALEILDKVKFDLVVSDISMPQMNGLQLLEALRQKKIQVPVIFVTGFADTTKMRQAWKLGAFDFIDKPVDASYLVSVVKKALEFGESFRAMNAESPESTPPAQFSPETLRAIGDAAAREGMSVEEWLKKRLP